MTLLWLFLFNCFVRVSHSYNERIAYGREVDPLLFPFVVHIRTGLPDEDFMVATCTGSLISRSVIITAGHCAGGDTGLIFKQVKFLRRTANGPIPYLTLPASLNYFAEVDADEYFSEHRVLKDDEIAYVDLALFSVNYSLPVCDDDANGYAILKLPIANINDSVWIPENGTIWDCKMLGFGAHEAGLHGETLRELHLSLRDHQTVLYTRALPGEEYGRACQGDSGGPVMCQLSDNGPRLIGITSSSFKYLYQERRGCYGEAHPMTYDLYVNIRRVLPVIRSGLQELGKLDEFIEDFNKCSHF